MSIVVRVKISHNDKVQCFKCGKTESPMWHRIYKDIMCNECNESDKTIKVEEDELKQTAVSDKPKASPRRSTKSTLNYKTRQNPNALPKQVALKGRGKRNVFKKTTPVKLQRPRSCFTSVNWVLHKSTLFRIGDIVSVNDEEGDTYYCQIKRLMLDEYCGKSASITWLIPTRNDSRYVKEGFDPLTFIAGPDDDLPRNLDCFEFVMHAPSDYFRYHSPLPTGLSQLKGSWYIWSRLGR
uniref:GATA zinc finger domain-containing protein 1 n=1 Tax=Cuerna arida TaxID=1464854 RepID=A0A1B6FQT2_9HEMI